MDSLIYLWACSFVGIVFGVAGIAKLRTISTFQGELINLNVFPPFLVKMFSWGAILSELLLSCLILTRMFLSETVWIASVILMMTFTLGALWIIFSGKSMECMCFGAGGNTKISMFTVMRNLFILAVSGVAFMGHADFNGSSFGMQQYVMGATLGILSFVTMLSLLAIQEVGLYLRGII